jgi:hypothetical protein
VLRTAKSSAALSTPAVRTIFIVLFLSRCGPAALAQQHGFVTFVMDVT